MPDKRHLFRAEFLSGVIELIPSDVERMKFVYVKAHLKASTSYPLKYEN